MNLKRILQLFSKPKKIVDRLRPRFRDLRRNERYNNADSKIRHLMDEGYLKLSWFDIFAEEHHESKLYKGMKNEMETFNVESSIASRGSKSGYLATKYTDGVSVTDGFLLRFMHQIDIDHYLRQYFGGNYLTNRYDYWVTKDSNDARVSTQRWHTDIEDPIMLKIFIYFDKVGQNNGATEIIAGTQGNCIRKWHRKKLSGGYSEEDEIEAKLTNYKDLIFRAYGKEGDIFLLDTTSLHRGGYGNEGRSMANITLTSTNCQYPFKWYNKSLGPTE